MATRHVREKGTHTTISSARLDRTLSLACARTDTLRLACARTDPLMNCPPKVLVTVWTSFVLAASGRMSKTTGVRGATTGCSAAEPKSQIQVVELQHTSDNTYCGEITSAWLEYTGGYQLQLNTSSSSLEWTLTVAASNQSLHIAVGISSV